MPYHVIWLGISSTRLHFYSHSLTHSLTSHLHTLILTFDSQEYHLQSILKEAGTSNDQEIPVPPPQESDINYDQLYPGHHQLPNSYIRFSQTVEESIGVAYDMTTEDDEYLKKYNSNRKGAGQLSEDDFEKIMDVFEEMASEHAPFASIDNTVVGYDMMVQPLQQLGSTKFMNHAKQVYEYWKTRRQESANKPLHPTLKFETHQDSDDTDPYVCFRRREARQTRKTRQRDVQSAEKLKRLRKELEDGRQLVILSYEREVQKREFLNLERMIFEQRAKLKEMKLKLGIKGEDDDLFNNKVCCLLNLHADDPADHPTSHRRGRQQMRQHCSALLEVPCAWLSDQMVGLWKPISSSSQTSCWRRRTSFVQTWNRRFRHTASGTRTTSISHAAPCPLSGMRAWK